MPEPFAAKLCSALALPGNSKAALVEYPMKGQSLGQSVPTDPLIYRFTMDLPKVEDPKGDRVVVTMNGKSLPMRSGSPRPMTALGAPTRNSSAFGS